ncbi:MAG: LicD family protein [Oscillospiraceae bacterium]|nr:LicD family protein [Oscillospiraceae bacterium]
MCEKHNITYFAHGGTLLGAVRHQGFIPWDDDIDIFMLPEDYRRFCEVAPKELKEPYFFQNAKTQPEVGFGLSRIRNSNTTGCTQCEYNGRAKKPTYNCGIFIDIFPLVYVPESKLKIAYHKAMMKFWRYVMSGRNYIKYINVQKGAKRVHWKELHHPSVVAYYVMSLFIKDEKFLPCALKAHDMFRSGKRVGMIPFYGYNEKCIWDKSFFDESVDLPFEDITIPCPKEYDKVLRKQYGDYTVFVKGAAVHTIAVMDPDTPYHIKLRDHYKEFEKK